MKVLVYARVSTSGQETENQVSQLLDYCSKQNWEVAEVVRDVASGSKPAEEREGLRRVFTMAHQKRFDLLLFWSLDRFSRQGCRETLSYLTTLDKYGVGLHSYTEPYFSSIGPFADAIVSIIATVAKQERIRIVERTKAGLERARRLGKRIGRPNREGVTKERAAELRSQGMSFTRIGLAMGVTRVRAYQLCRALNVASDTSKCVISSS